MTARSTTGVFHACFERILVTWRALNLFIAFLGSFSTLCFYLQITSEVMRNCACSSSSFVIYSAHPKALARCCSQFFISSLIVERSCIVLGGRRRLHSYIMCFAVWILAPHVHVGVGFRPNGACLHQNGLLQI